MPKTLDQLLHTLEPLRHCFRRTPNMSELYVPQCRHLDEAITSSTWPDNADNADNADSIGEMKIVSWNIEYGLQYDKIIGALKYRPDLKDADFILLQEVDQHTPRSQQKDLAVHIADELGFGYVHGIEFVEHRYANDNGQEPTTGNTTFSRYEPISSAIIRLPTDKDWSKSKTQPRTGGRNGIATIYMVGTKRLLIINTHLETHTHPFVRWYQLKYICGYAEQQQCDGIVIAGDMNSIFGRKEVLARNIVESGYAEAANGIHHRTVRILPWLYNHLDRVFARGCEVIKHEVKKVPGSDHYPVVVRIVI